MYADAIGHLREPVQKLVNTSIRIPRPPQGEIGCKRISPSPPEQDCYLDKGINPIILYVVWSYKTRVRGDRRISFHAESSARKSQLVILYVFLVIALLSLFGLKIALITCLYFEGMTLFCFIICFVLVSKTRWLLDFQDNVLILTNTANHNQYRLDDLTVSDFHFKQTAVQKKANRCDLKLANLPFGLYGVNNYEQLKAYIISAY